MRLSYCRIATFHVEAMLKALSSIVEYGRFGVRFGLAWLRIHLWKIYESGSPFKWGKNKVGKMALAITKIDEKGRMTIPKANRKKAGIKPGTCVSVKSKDHSIIIGPSESIAEKYAGTFQISKWPEDLDEFMTEATKKWWIP